MPSLHAPTVLGRRTKALEGATTHRANLIGRQQKSEKTPVFACQTHRKNVILRACDFSIFSCFLHPTNWISSPHDKGVILSEARRASIANRGLYGAESKDPGDACWQMLLGVFRPLKPAASGPATSFPWGRVLLPNLTRSALGRNDDGLIKRGRARFQPANIGEARPL
jgi:hypothetical protein